MISRGFASFASATGEFFIGFIIRTKSSAFTEFNIVPKFTGNSESERQSAIPQRQEKADFILLACQAGVRRLPDVGWSLSPTDH